MKTILFLLCLISCLSATQFVIIIPSYNNSSYIEKNLGSVLEQKGEDWRAIYIDDCSKDDTYEKAEKILSRSPKGAKVSLMRNSVRCGALENLYRAIHTCRDDEVVVLLDGDDWFPRNEVISYLKDVYKDPYIWMTYGSYARYPKGIKGECSQKMPPDVLFGDQIRHAPWVTSHLRTFYAGLFKKIKLEDLLYEGRFFPMTWDQAVIFPMIEMARDHSQYIGDILYVYNETNPINDAKVNKRLMRSCKKKIQEMPPYSPLKQAPHQIQKQEESLYPDLVIFSYDRPLQLFALLESVHKWGSHLGRISVICRTSNEEYARAYEEIHKTFPHVIFFPQSQRAHADFKTLTLSAIYTKASKSDYVVFAVDDILIKEEIDFKKCALALEKTQANGFFLRLAPHVDYCYSLNKPQSRPQLLALEEDLLVWQFKKGKGDWAYPHSLDMTIYKKSVIEKDLREMEYIHPNQLESAWAKRAPQSRIGICFDRTKMVNIPLNIVNISSNRHMEGFSTEELLEKFHAGLKIDIAPIYRIENHSAHIEFHPTYIKR